jgi:uncharacterized protein with von Willebrand factor type A (vWA) domain
VALLDRHVAFVEALRTAGMPVSLTEDLDAVRAVTRLGLADREVLRSGLAATLVKRQSHRPGFDALFDLYFPAIVGSGTRAERTADYDGSEAASPEGAAELGDRLVEALADDDRQAVQALAVAGVEQLGAMPGRGPGLSAWSSYNTLRALDPDALVARLTRALTAGSDDRAPRSEEVARLTAARRVERFRSLVESDVRRRIAEDRTPEYVARTSLRPTVDQLSFTSARRSEIEEMRRQVYPLARRLATRLAKEQHARRRGPLDFRRTVRASVSTGGVPLTTHHRPRRPHRTELVVLCDVSGSVASFASFTLLLVYALREQFTKVRAFTFVDDVHEVTAEFRPGADPAETLERLSRSARHASRWGRTDYGRAFRAFQENHADALGPRTSLLVLGDARSNYTDPRPDTLRAMVRAARHAWWLNPEHPRQWDTGDSAASEYRAILPMVECRNLAQLTEFVHDIV